MHWAEVQLVVWCGLVRTCIFIVVCHIKAVLKFDFRRVVNCTTQQMVTDERRVK